MHRSSRPSKTSSYAPKSPSSTTRGTARGIAVGVAVISSPSMPPEPSNTFAESPTVKLGCARPKSLRSTWRGTRYKKLYTDYVNKSLLREAETFNLSSFSDGATIKKMSSLLNVLNVCDATPPITTNSIIDANTVCEMLADMQQHSSIDLVRRGESEEDEEEGE